MRFSGSTESTESNIVRLIDTFRRNGSAHENQPANGRFTFIAQGNHPKTTTTTGNRAQEAKTVMSGNDTAVAKSPEWTNAEFIRWGASGDGPGAASGRFNSA